MYGPDDREWVEPEEAARRMGITIGQLDALIKRGGVRARRNGWAVEVEPAVLNVTPEEPPKPKRHHGTTKRAPHTPVRGRR
jgi:hypothetical protein